MLSHKMGYLKHIGNCFVLLIRTVTAEHMVNYWLVLEPSIQYTVNFLQDGSYGSNLVESLVTSANFSMFY